MKPTDSDQTNHSHGHHHHDHEMSHLSPEEVRVRALESLLIDKGYVEREALDLLVQTY